MKNEIFKDLLTENEIKEAMRSINDPWQTKENLKRDVNDAVIGLQDLLITVKKAQAVVNDDPDYYILESIKKNNDVIVCLLENFANEFKPLYEEISVKYIAAKLSQEETTDDSVKFIGDISDGTSTYNAGWGKNKK